MPTITAQNQTFDCSVGANLRQELLKQNIELYNGGAAVINCHGFGTCGTCAVKIVGEVSEMAWQERTRLSLPPHSGQLDRRLACQVKVLGDVSVTKLAGFWGQDDQTVWTAEK